MTAHGSQRALDAPLPGVHVATPLSPSQALRRVLAFAAVTAVLAPVAYLAMFTGFHPYDDEGYFLVTLRDYMSGHPLLTPYTPLYGPFFYEAMSGLFKLFGLQPGHDVGRYVTAAVWLIASLAGGLAAYRLTRSLWLGVVAQGATFCVLSALVNEPMTTYGLSSLLVLCLVLAAGLRPSRLRAAAALIGAIAAALFLIKVNVGVFAAIAVAFAWAAGLPQARKRFLLPMMAVAMTALPLVLMAGLLGQDWVFEFAVLAALSAAAVGLACVAAAPPLDVPPPGKWLALGAAVTMIAGLGAALAGGTRLEDLWNGLVVAAIRTPHFFLWPTTIYPGYDAWAALLFVAAVAIFLRKALVWSPPAVTGVARVGAGLFTWVSLLLLPSSLFLLALPLAWLATQAPVDDVNNPTDPYVRVLLPALAVLESLQAYPTAGTQLSLAALPLVLVGAVLLNDGIRQLRLDGKPRSARLQVAGWCVPAAALVTIAAFLVLAIQATAGFETSKPLGLPGAESMRMPAQQGTQLHGLIDAIDRNCSSFITLPGMNSLYLWTAEAPPTQLRYGQWWLILDAADEQSTIAQLQARQRVCVVKNQAVASFWLQGRQLPSSPLLKYIDANFVDSGSYGDYELLTSVNR
jgi:hypothetical protein